jgi:photosystem II stability/assembly factor-like uncharacterized protein
MRAAALVLIVSAALSTTGRARANGRFPEAQVIESVPGDPSTLFLRATFGVLVSRDGGKSWRWICERALGYEGQWDPPVAVTRDGRLWIGLEDGLTWTADGCHVDAIPELDNHTIKDLTTDPRGETLWAITGAPGKRSYVWRRSPGQKFERLADLGETNLMTIEVAPSLPSRVYVSGQPYTTIRGRIYRSDDGGRTFRTELVDAGAQAADAGKPVTADGLVADGPMFIGAVDPSDPSRLLVRHLHAKGSDLLLSRDGGKTFKNVLWITSAMYGFAKSRDGKTYWAGSGLPEHGIYRSTDRGEHFERVGNHGVLCLHAAAPDALFVCQNALSLGAPAIAVSRDQGATITSLARFTDIAGPVDCPTEARASLCAGSWPETKQFISPPEDAGSEDAGRPAKRSKRDAGKGGKGDASDASTRRSSCTCEAAGAAGSGPDRPLFIAGLLPLAVRIRFRRRRGSTVTRPGNGLLNRTAMADG